MELERRWLNEEKTLELMVQRNALRPDTHIDVFITYHPKDHTKITKIAMTKPKHQKESAIEHAIKMVGIVESPLQI